MATPATTSDASYSTSLLDDKLSKSSTGKWGMIVFGILLAGGMIYIGTRLSADLAIVHSPTIFPYILLGIALLIALGFEFVNGFHDTANAVATVIYTHSLEPHIAVVYSGILNFVGVLLSSGAVAFSIITLLPVELILKVGKGSGFSMVFALLVAAILWNLATWNQHSDDLRGVNAIAVIGNAGTYTPSLGSATGLGSSGILWSTTVNDVGEV